MNSNLWNAQNIKTLIKDESNFEKGLTKDLRYDQSAFGDEGFHLPSAPPPFGHFDYAINSREI